VKLTEREKMINDVHMYVLAASDEEVLALARILGERGRQDKKWGVQAHAPAVWHLIASEELGEVAKAVLERRTPYTIEAEFVQVGAVALAAVAASLAREGEI
jgi:hypothetical protein